MKGRSWITALSGRARRRRFGHFVGLVHSLPSLPAPLSVLDVGGTEEYWRQVHAFGQFPQLQLQFTLLNLELVPITHSAFSSTVGDARSMPEFADGQFDLVFSNSVIEHVGDLDDQARMASEIRRVGQRYYVQSPNRNFPVEPHYFLPYFQFYPHFLKVWTLRLRGATPDRAQWGARRIRLMTERELRSVFPRGRIWREKVAWMTKSLVVYGGWESDSLRE